MSEEIYRRLLAAARKSCLPAVWNRGVGLARSHTVVTQSIEDDEIILRVKGALVSPTVTLWPEDEDWWCDCDEDSDAVCEHVAASIIVMLQSSTSGQALPTRDASSAKINYELYLDPRGRGVCLRRVITQAERRAVLRGSIKLATGEGVDGMRVVADPIDLAVERIVAGLPDDLIPVGIADRLLAALKPSSSLTFEGEPFRIGDVAPPFEIVLEDDHTGFLLTMRPNRCIDEKFPNGIVRCGDTLRPLGQRGVNERQTSQLRRGMHFSFSDTAQLLSDLIPSLEKHLPVRINAKRLPSISHKLRPRIAIEAQRLQDGMSVLATIVYGDPVVARVDGDRLTQLGKVMPKRRADLEQRLRRQLDNDLGLAPGRREFLPAERAIRLSEQLKRAMEQGVTVEGDGPRSFFLAGKLQARVRGGVDDLDMELYLQGSRSNASVSPSAVVRAWQAGASLVPLSTGGWAELPHDWLARYGRQIADLLAAREASADATLPKSAIPSLARLQAELDLAPAPSFAAMRALLEEQADLPEVPLPDDVQTTLRDYQVQGVRWLGLLQHLGLGALLADDMGLGKTLQALCVLPRDGKTLVVAPTSVVHNWADEAHKFRPSLRVHVYHGPRRKLDPDADVTITTYGVLRLDIPRLASRTWDVVILDEAQAIKNPASQAAQAAFRLRTRFPIVLTGTPVENRLDELWSLMNFTNRGLLGGRSSFDKTIAQPIAKGDKSVAARLREKLRPVLLRRLKRDVAKELPARTEMVLRCQLSEREQDIYHAVHAATVPSVVEKLRQGAGVMAALEALLRLRQACCHSSLIPGQIIPAKLDTPEEPPSSQPTPETSSKLGLLMERLDEAIADGHKSLVFSQWTSLLDLVEPLLRARGITFLRLDGSTRDRAGVVSAFQRTDGAPVLLISLKAGGTGLNLTEADHVFLLDPWWNPAVEDQAADRAHRIGQTRPVFVHKLVAEDTVEERILELQERKRALSEAAVGEGAAAVSLTKDDLLAMLDG